MSKISNLMYGNLAVVDDTLEIGEATEQELCCAIQNLCRVIVNLEKRVMELERK